MPFYTSNYLSDCFVYYTIPEAIDIIIDAMHWPTMAFDYETTGIKPFREGHKIFSVSLSNGLFSHAFPYFNDKKFRKAWDDLLQSDVVKICHNAKYEALWSKVRGGYNNTELPEWPKNILHDTMLNAHVIDNRKKVGLKYLAYVKFGIAGYDDEIDQYLEPDKKEKELYGANAINRIEKAPLDKLLLYNAMDSLLTYKLWGIQRS